MSKRIVRARKDYQCNMCGGTIPKGEQYRYDNFRVPGGYQDETGELVPCTNYVTDRTCLDQESCEETRKASMANFLDTVLF